MMSFLNSVAGGRWPVASAFALKRKAAGNLWSVVSALVLKQEGAPATGHWPLATKFLLICVVLFSRLTPAIAQQDLMRGTVPEGNVRIDQRLGRNIPRDLEFRDDSGRKVLLGDFFKEGKPVIITPVYYRCPMLCSVVLEGVVNTLRDLRFDVGKEFEVVTVSFDARETPADARQRKEKYLRHYGRKGAAEGWHFLTGDEKNVSALMHALGFRYQWDPKINQWAHGTTIVVATPDAKISRYFFGISYPPRDVRLGLVEAADRKIGTVADQLLLLCYHYDPASGKYTAGAMNFVRLGSTATVAALAGFILIMLRRERRSPKA